MPELKKPSSYWRKAFRVSWKEIGMPEAIAAGVAGMIAAALALCFGFAQAAEKPELLFICLVSAVGGVILEFIIRLLFITPAKIHHAVEEEKQSLQANVEALSMQLNNATDKAKQTKDAETDEAMR